MECVYVYIYIIMYPRISTRLSSYQLGSPRSFTSGAERLWTKMKRRREDGEKWLPPSDPQLKIEGKPQVMAFFWGKMMENDDQSVDLGKKMGGNPVCHYICLFIPIVQSIFIMFSVHSLISSFDGFVCYFETSGLAFSAMPILNSTEGSLSKIWVENHVDRQPHIICPVPCLFHLQLQFKFLNSNGPTSQLPRPHFAARFYWLMRDTKELCYLQPQIFEDLQIKWEKCVCFLSTETCCKRNP